MVEPGEPGEQGETGEQGGGRSGRIGGVGGAGGAGGRGGKGEPTGAGGEGGIGGEGGRGESGGRFSSPRFKLAAYALIVVVMAFGLWRVEDQGNRIERESATRADETCVTGWMVRADIRSAIDRATRAGAEAIIAIADAEPQVVEAYRAQIEDRIQAAVDEIADPDCDLDAARRRLADG